MDMDCKGTADLAARILSGNGSSQDEAQLRTHVASCAPCNRRKGNRLPQEVRMHPKRNPRPPGPTVFIRIAAPRTPEAWEPYLLAA